MPKGSEFWYGSKEQTKQLPTMTGQQRQYLDQLMQQLQQSSPEMWNYLNSLLSGEGADWEAFSAPYMRQFEEETIPGIAERFGGVGAQSSSGFQQALGKAGAGLQEQLAQLRAQLRMGAAQQIQGMMGQGLGQRAFENVYIPRGQGFLQGMAPAIGGALGSAVTMGMQRGGPTPGAGARG